VLVTGLQLGRKRDREEAARTYLQYFYGTGAGQKENKPRSHKKGTVGAAHLSEALMD